MHSWIPVDKLCIQFLCALISGTDYEHSGRKLGFSAFEYVNK